MSLFSFLMVVRTGLLLVVDSNSACWPLAMSARVVTSSLIWRWISAARAYRAAAVAGSVTSSGGLAQVVSWRARYALALHASVQYRGLRPPPGLGWSGRAVSQCRHRAGWPVSFRDVASASSARIVLPDGRVTWSGQALRIRDLSKTVLALVTTTQCGSGIPTLESNYRLCITPDLLPVG